MEIPQLLILCAFVLLHSEYARAAYSGGSEFFWDYICPFSGKSAKCIKEVVIPWLESHAKGKVKIFFRLQVQPWCVHAFIIVTLVAPPSSRIA